MATSIFWGTNKVDTDANFRLWGKGVSDAMDAVGFTKTADTGQVDWALVAKPVGVNNYPGYEIRAFTDTIQASTPIIVKIEYGSGQYQGGVRVTVGRETDGAGNLIGETTSSMRCESPYSGTADSGSHPCIICGGDGHIEVFLFIDAGSYNFAFWVSRVKDDEGADTDLGIDLGVQYQNSSFQVFFPKKGLQYPLAGTSAPTCLAPGVGPFSYAGNLGIFPVCTGLGYVANPNLSALVWDGVSINSVGSVITINVFGDPHDFMITTLATGTINGMSGCKLAVRYE